MGNFSFDDMWGQLSNEGGYETHFGEYDTELAAGADISKLIGSDGPMIGILQKIDEGYGLGNFKIRLEPRKNNETGKYEIFFSVTRAKEKKSGGK